MDLFSRTFNHQLDLLIDALETGTQPAPLVTANTRLQRLESILARQLAERAGLDEHLDDLRRQTAQLDAQLQDLQRQLSLAEQRWQGCQRRLLGVQAKAPAQRTPDAVAGTLAAH